MSIALSVITQLDDPRFADAFRIWDAAFPPEEKIPPLFWLEYFAAQHHPDRTAQVRHKELLAVHAAEPGIGEATIGMALLEITHSPDGEKVGFLRYLAIDENSRGNQIGSRTFAALCERAFRRFGCSILVWEVEPPDRDPDALRRYRWYQRMGGRRVLGIEYSIQMPGQSPVTLWVMVIGGTGEENRADYDAVCAALETQVQITGVVSLESRCPGVHDADTSPAP